MNTDPCSRRATGRESRLFARSAIRFFAARWFGSLTTSLTNCCTISGKYRQLYLGLPGNWRVLRGGSFNNNANNARAAYRNNNVPGNRNNNNGFRVVVVVRRSTPHF